MNQLITFEGVEGCGKTTQIRMAADYLAKEGVNFITSDEPGGTPLGRKIREILLNRGPYSISPHAELLLFAAARAQHVNDIISPALRRGAWVLCDRFIDATLAYQGFGRGLDVNFIKQIHLYSSNDLEPGLTLLFDLPVDIGLRRAMARIARKRGAALEDRFERENGAFHRKIREGYLALAEKNPQRFRIIDASREMPAVYRDVCRHLSTYIGSFR